MISGFPDHAFLSHSHIDRMESKECCRAGRTEPSCPWRSLGSCWAMTGGAKSSYPELIFMESSSYWSQPEELRKAQQGVCCHLCLWPTQIKQLHNIRGDKWSVPKPQESAIHRYSGAVGCNDQGPPVPGHWFRDHRRGAEMGWEDLLCSQYPGNLSSLLLTPLMGAMNPHVSLPSPAPLKPPVQPPNTPEKKPGLQAFCREYCSQCFQKLKPCTGCSADMREA